MMKATNRAFCVICDKEKATFKCGGCLNEFCFNHLTDHKLDLSKQLDDVAIHRDLFQEILSEQIVKPQKHVLIQQIAKWENDAIDKIRQTADEARQLVLKYNTEHNEQMVTRLNNLTEQLRQSREENDFFETDICRWNEELTQLTNEFTKPTHINLRQSATALVTKISVGLTSVSFYTPKIDIAARWVQNGVTVAGGNRQGESLNQLSNPWGLYVDDDQTVYVAEYSNHRIVEWKCNATSGQVVGGGNGRGNQMNQLYAPADVIIDKYNDCLIIADYANERVVRWPRNNGSSGQIIIPNIDCWGLALDSDGYLYVADYNKYEVRKWRIGDSSGALVAGGNGKGNRLDQLNGRFYIFVDENHSVYVSDEENHRVMKWIKGAKEGIVVAGNQSKGNNLTQLSSPKGVAVDQLGTIYVADQNNHRIMRWPQGAKKGNILVGENGKGENNNQLFNPIGLKFDQQGNLYVVDNGNCRVQRFNVDLSTSL